MIQKNAMIPNGDQPKMGLTECLLVRALFLTGFGSFWVDFAIGIFGHEPLSHHKYLM